MPSKKRASRKKKGSKGKENKKQQKKLQREAELAAEKLRTEVVATANAAEDPMAKFLPFKTFKRNGLDLRLEFFKRKNMSAENFDFCFELLSTNMSSLYEKSGWGWKGEKKKKELGDELSRFLVLYAGEEPVGFAMFRFDIEGTHEVLYLYELQLTAAVRRKGVGRHVMLILELMAKQFKMKWVMLTVFKCNPASMAFFTKKMKYEIDETSPGQQTIWEEAEYEILSKCMDKSVLHTSAKLGMLPGEEQQASDSGKAATSDKAALAKALGIDAGSRVSSKEHALQNFAAGSCFN